MKNLTELTTQLFEIADFLDNAASQIRNSTADMLKRVRDSANEVGRAWSGGWLGYHSRVYYTNFQPVPAGAHFSTEWGFDTSYVTHPTIGEWSEFTFDEVRGHIFAVAGVKSLDEAEEF